MLAQEMKNSKTASSSGKEKSGVNQDIKIKCEEQVNSSKCLFFTLAFLTANYALAVQGIHSFVVFIVSPKFFPLHQV